MLEERLPVERLELDREEVEREAVERDPVERFALERVGAERAALERFVVREPLRAVPDVDRVLRDEREDEEEAFACVSAWRSLSKSLSACLFVREALRRSAARAVVTSL